MCMSPSHLQFILDEIRCLNASVSELSQEKTKLTENIINELKTNTKLDKEVTGDSNLKIISQIADAGKKSSHKAVTGSSIHEIDLVSGTINQQKPTMNYSQSHPLRLSSTQPASGYLIFGPNQPPTPIQPRPGSQASNVGQNQQVQQHLTQIDGVRQQVTREVESLKSKLEQSENGRNNLVQELAQMKNQLDRLELLRTPPVVEPPPPAPVPRTPPHSTELIDRFFVEFEHLKSQLANLTKSKEVPQIQQPSAESLQLMAAENERKRLEQIVHNLSSQIEQINVRNSRQNQTATESVVVTELRRVAQSLSNELNDVRGRLKEANSQLLASNEMRLKQPMLESEIVRLRSEAELNRTQLIETKQQLSSGNDKLLRLSEDIEAKSRLEQSYQMKEVEAQRVIQELKSQVSSLNSQNDKLALELQMKSDRMTELEKAKESLQNQQASHLAMSAEHHHQFFEEIEQLKSENHELKRRLGLLQTENEQFQQKLKSDVKSSSQEINAIEASKRDLEQRFEGEIGKLKAQISNLIRERECSNCELEAARQERYRLLDDLSKAHVGVEQLKQEQIQNFEAEINKLRQQVESSRHTINDDVKQLVVAVSSGLDDAVDKTVFSLSLVAPQFEGDVANSSLRMAIDDPPAPLNFNRMASYSELAMYLREKSSWLARNLDRLCNILDRQPLIRTAQQPRDSSSPLQPQYNAGGQDLLNAAYRSINSGRRSRQHVRRSYEALPLDQCNRVLSNDVAVANSNNDDDPNSSQSQVERGKLFDLILRSQQVLGDLKVDLCQSDKVMEKLKPRVLRQQEAHFSCENSNLRPQPTTATTTTTSSPLNNTHHHHHQHQYSC